jgi:hypothetical protein
MKLAIAPTTLLFRLHFSARLVNNINQLFSILEEFQFEGNEYGILQVLENIVLSEKGRNYTYCWCESFDGACIASYMD